MLESLLWNEDGNIKVLPISTDSVKRHCLNTVVIGDDLYIYGGYPSLSDSGATNRFVKYNFKTGTWTILASAQARAFHGLETYNGLIYLFAGQNGSTVYNDIRVYD